MFLLSWFARSKHEIIRKVAVKGVMEKSIDAKLTLVNYRLSTSTMGPMARLRSSKPTQRNKDNIARMGKVQVLSVRLYEDDRKNLYSLSMSATSNTIPSLEFFCFQ